MKICFLQTSNRAFSDTQMFGIYFMPVWAYTLASHLERILNVQIALFDERVHDRSTLPEAEIYLLTGINQDADAIWELRDYVRKKHPTSCICLGGPITWSYHTAGKLNTITAFDYIFVGDAEETLPQFVQNLISNKRNEKIVQASRRFDLEKALKMSDTLLKPTYRDYYGGVIEVSRGCPFLCEFCDIRVLPDNNRSHTKNADVILEELDTMAKLGIGQVLFACDNFIGNLSWAEEVCDKIIAWSQKTGLGVSLYTWLTINLSKHPRLLNKLRSAGFDMFFVGVESFHQSSLLETAKVQNTGGQLVEAIREIQSYGFIVVAGLIFGFDSDPNNASEVALSGILASGLISGDPSLLMALPGTPLYHRMKLSGRLRDMKFNLGGFKYQTNIKYLREADKVKEDFLFFVREFTAGPYQFQRLQSFYSCLESERYIPPRTAGYANMSRLLKMTFRDPIHIRSLIIRFGRLLSSPRRLKFIFRAWLWTYRLTTKQKPLWFYFKFWLFNWSNALVKYAGLSERDFNIDWVGPNFQIGAVLPEHYDVSDEQIPVGKTKNQRQITSLALKELIEKRKGTVTVPNLERTSTNELQNTSAHYLK